MVFRNRDIWEMTGRGEDVDVDVDDDDGGGRRIFQETTSDNCLGQILQRIDGNLLLLPGNARGMDKGYSRGTFYFYYNARFG